MKYKSFSNQVNQLCHRESIVSNSLDIEGIEYEKEVRKDIEIQDMHYISIWGQVKDYNDHPVEGEWVRLIRLYEENGEEKIEMVKKTITDGLGYYNLDVYGRQGECYTVLVDCQGTNEGIIPVSSRVGGENRGIIASRYPAISQQVKFSN